MKKIILVLVLGACSAVTVGAQTVEEVMGLAQSAVKKSRDAAAEAARASALAVADKNAGLVETSASKLPGTMRLPIMCRVCEWDPVRQETVCHREPCNWGLAAVRKNSAGAFVTTCASKPSENPSGLKMCRVCEWDESRQEMVCYREPCDYDALAQSHASRPSLTSRGQKMCRVCEWDPVREEKVCYREPCDY